MCFNVPARRLAGGAVLPASLSCCFYSLVYKLLLRNKLCVPDNPFVSEVLSFRKSWANTPYIGPSCHHSIVWHRGAVKMRTITEVHNMENADQKKMKQKYRSLTQNGSFE
jgi:hypothetical protein